MKTYFLNLSILGIALLAVSCGEMDTATHDGDADARRADSMWKVHIADSIIRAREGVNADPTARTNPADTGAISVETITTGMKEGLGKVQEGLDKMKKVTEVSSNRAKEISDGIKKTSDAIYKTVDEAKKTIKGE